MTDELELLAATTTDLLGRCREAGVTPQGAWGALAAAGLTGIGVREADGGSGGDLAAAAVVVRRSARFAETAELPLGATLLLAHWLRDATHLAVDLSATAVSVRGVLQLRETVDGLRLTGTAARLPGACGATSYLLRARAADGTEHVVSTGAADTTPGLSVETDPVRTGLGLGTVRCDEVGLTEERVRELPPDVAQALALRAELLTAVQVSGMLDEALALTLRYTRDREQFGRPIGEFQMVKDQLAVMAGEVAVARAASGGAVAAVGWRGADLAVRAAALRTRRAATVVARLAHQLHGTIGVTQEHALHRLTTRLWHASTADGSLADAERALGQAVTDRGADGFWPAVVS